MRKKNSYVYFVIGVIVSFQFLFLEMKAVKSSSWKEYSVFVTLVLQGTKTIYVWKFLLYANASCTNSHKIHKYTFPISVLEE